MEDWANKLKVETLLARGVTEPNLLSIRTEFDEALVCLAARVLPTAEKLVFFFAFACRPNWEDILSLLHERLDKEYDLSTVKTYADRALNRITAEAKKSTELDQWQTARRRSRIQSSTAR